MIEAAKFNMIKKNGDSSAWLCCETHLPIEEFSLKQLVIDKPWRTVSHNQRVYIFDPDPHSETVGLSHHFSYDFHGHFLKGSSPTFTASPEQELPEQNCQCLEPGNPRGSEK